MQFQACGKCSHLAESYEKCVIDRSNYMMEIRTLQTRIVSGYEAELTVMQSKQSKQALMKRQEMCTHGGTLHVFFPAKCF